MSGEITVIPGYDWNLEEGEEVTLEKLQRMASDLVLQVQALSITERELADGAVTADKLDAEISGQLGLADGSVTTAKLASTFLCPVSKGGTGGTTAAAARANLGAGVQEDVEFVAITSGTEALTQTVTDTYTYTIADFDGVGVDPDSIRGIYIDCYVQSNNIRLTQVLAQFPGIVALQPLSAALGGPFQDEISQCIAFVPINAGQLEVEIENKGTATHRFTIIGATQRVVA